MPFQYQIYPTGATSNYKVLVSNVLGVSAIVDRAMGINENSMSGVAFYINAIENFLNHHNVGSGTLRITSGFFDNLGFAGGETVSHIDGDGNTVLQTFDKGRGDYFPSTDGITSGIFNIWASGITADLEQDLDIGVLKATSGTFTNLILHEVFGNQRIVESINISGSLTNVFSGAFNSVVSDIILTESGNPNYFVRHDFPILRSLVTNSELVQGRRDITKYGIYSGVLTVRDLTDLSSDNLLSEGNFYVDSHVEIDVSLLGSGQFSENILQIDAHNHDGVNSRKLSADALNSSRPVSKPFDVTLSSGDLTVFGNINSTHGLGFSVGWQRVPISGIAAPQKLVSVGDDLIIVGKKAVTSLRGRSFNIPTSHDRIMGQNSVSYTADGVGDGSYEFTTISYPLTSGTAVVSGNIEQDITFRFWPGFPDKGREAVLTSPIISGTFVRHINHIDSGTRVYSNLYQTVYERNTIDTNFQVTLLEYNFIDMQVNRVATIQSEAHATGFLLTKPFQLNGNVVMPYRVPESGTFSFYTHNPVYNHLFAHSGLVDTINPPVSSGEIVFHRPSGVPLVGKTGNTLLRHVTDFTEYEGNIIYLVEDELYRVSLGDGYEPRFLTTGFDGSSSVVSYAGRIYTGQALEISFDEDGTRFVDINSTESLKLVTGNRDPWVASPVVHDGWLYGLAPAGETPYSGWTQASFLDKYDVDYDIPEGAILVRKRAAARNLVVASQIYG